MRRDRRDRWLSKMPGGVGVMREVAAAVENRANAIARAGVTPRQGERINDLRSVANRLHLVSCVLEGRVEAKREAKREARHE